MPIRVLHIVSVMNRGGIETLLMNIYRKIDREKVQFDFLYNREEEGVFEEEIKNLGGKVYKIPHMSKIGYLKHKNAFEKFLQEHREYKIIHCHMNTWCGLYLPIAKKNGVSTRIAHSHIAQAGEGVGVKAMIRSIIKSYHKIFINAVATDRFACSREAGEWLYGNIRKEEGIIIINNGIDTEKFKFSPATFRVKREELRVSEDVILLGHVGRFNTQKNHEGLIDIFYRVAQSIPNMKLCLVGDGELRIKIEKKVSCLGIEDKVMFLGTRADVNELMMAFDIFIFPSLFEGLGIVGVEAQATGLPCLIADTIPEEADMKIELVEKLPVNNIELWEYSLKNWVIRIKNKQDRGSAYTKVKNNGYDIQDVAGYLQNFYYRKIGGSVK